MATACLSDPIFRPVSNRFLSSRRPSTSRPAFISLSPSKQFKTGRSSSVVVSKTENSSSKWAVRMSLVEQIPSKSTVDVKRLVDFLYEDLPHLFDDQGIDRTAYSDSIKYRDPITKHETITGYLFNIAMLKKIFTPDFQLHWVKPTGPYEITTRWTMVMRFILLPWKPELIFTGTSVMGINPETGKFCSHAVGFSSPVKSKYCRDLITDPLTAAVSLTHYIYTIAGLLGFYREK